MQLHPLQQCHLKRLTDKPNGAYWPGFSYDGKYVVYSARTKEYEDCESFTLHDLFIIDIENRISTTLIDDCNGNLNPSFSPDGEKIVFASSRGDTTDNIFVIGRDGTNKKQLTFENDGSTADQPSYSPDGKKITFRSYKSSSSDIWIMNPDGTEQVNLTRDAHVDQEPKFSPDGTKIVFSSNRFASFERDYEICVMDIDGSNITQLTDADGNDSRPSWTP